MAELTLAKIKSYGHFTDDEDDDIQDLWDAADEYLAEAGVSPALAGTPRYNLAVKALVLHWHDNRGDTAQGTANGDKQAEIPLGLSSLITQMKCYVEPMV